MDDKIILIGGAPTVGKSHLAKKLADDLKLPWISTDMIREWMRRVVTHREDFPHLFDFDERELADPVEYLTSHTAQQIVDHQNLESVQIWKGVEALIESGYIWGSFIIEGVAILPQQVYELMKKNKNVHPVFLTDHDSDRLRDIIYKRGLWNDADQYPDSVKPKELEWTMLFNSWVESECAKYGLPAVEVTVGSEEYLAKVRELIS